MVDTLARNFQIVEAKCMRMCTRTHICTHVHTHSHIISKCCDSFPQNVLQSGGFSGYPAEVFAFGGQYMLVVFGMAGGALLARYFMVPVFYPLRLISVNEVNANVSSLITRYWG